MTPHSGAMRAQAFGKVRQRSSRREPSRERFCSPRARRTSERATDEITCCDELVDVYAALDAQTVQHVQHVFGRDVARGAFRVRASAESCNRAVERRDTALERRVDVRYGLPVRVV